MMDQIIEKLKSLKLCAMGENLPQVMSEAQEKNLPFQEILERLLDLELEARERNKVIRCFQQSKLHEKPTLDQFDFEFHHSRKKQKSKILNLVSLSFVEQKKDLVFIGNPGVGKSFLAKCVAYAATQAAIKVLFTTAMEMINHLIAAQADHTLLKKLKSYQTPDLLVIDEIGYLPLGKEGSNLFFQVISARHEIHSTLITTNLPFADWGNIFDSTTVATAIADRLVYRSEVLILEGRSYRVARQKE